MKRSHLILCGLSGVFGAMSALVFVNGGMEEDSFGQVESPRPKPVATGQATTLIDDTRESGLRGADAGASVSRFTPQERRNIAVYESVNRCVVNINTLTVNVDSFIGLAQPEKGAGSGSVLDRRGHILTNHHVIDGARQIRVTLFNGDSYDAALVGQDPANDTAVLKIDAPKDVLFPVKLGASTGLRVGQHVYAIGNPFGLERTLTMGILSSLNRTLAARNGRSIKSIIQIDAALNRGNSGGPLLDSQGQLIGMNTAIASATGENTGVGFAIPVNTIKRIVPQLIEKGRVIRPTIGVARVYETGRGLVIAMLSPGGPAQKAGLRGFRVVRRQVRRGSFIYEERVLDRDHADTIVAVQGKRITDAEDFLEKIEARKPGETVTITVLRDDRPKDFEVVLGISE